MNYHEVQELVGGKHGCFSADIDGVNWDADWGSQEFAEAEAFDAIAFEGTKMVVHEGWNLSHKEELTNPTWKDIMEFFNRAIVAVDDYHHSFFEGLTENRRGEMEVSAGS